MEALVNVRGWVGSQVELRETSKGPVLRFRVATTSRYRRGDQWVDGDTTWLTVTAWRALARNAASSLHKGDPVMVSGRLRTESWQGKDERRHEDKILDAVCIGHDLTRGESRFTRVRHEEMDGRPTGYGSGAADAGMRSGDGAAERADVEEVDEPDEDEVPEDLHAAA